jgi:tetratricopeptide (TPR) repeat protein
MVVNIQWHATGRLAMLLAACMTLCACATQAVQIPAIPELHGQPRYDIESVDLLAMSTEMKQFVEAQLTGRDFGDDRAWALAYAMLDPFILDFDYDPLVTLTASEAFRTRRGNCLTFSNLFVAMAREAGLNAWYREVEIAPEWSSIDDTLLVSMHVNAATSDRGTDYVVDVSRRRPRDDERVRKLSDYEAEAMFYNNLGAHALVANDLPMAYAYFRKAISIHDRLPYAWTNMGVVLRRNEQTEDAILAYETALKIDDDHSAALNNLFSIYDEDGPAEAAEAIAAKVERNRRRNPFYLNYLAEIAIEEERWEEAIRYANRAIRLQEDEYRFYYRLAQSQYQAGEISRAESSLQTARQLAPKGADLAELVLPGELPRPSQEG